MLREVEGVLREAQAQAVLQNGEAEAVLHYDEVADDDDEISIRRSSVENRNRRRCPRTSK